MPEETFERGMPEEYAMPMTNMINRFSKATISPGEVASPAVVAVAVAVVIVLWTRPLDEMVRGDDEKRSLKFAAEQIRAKPELVRQMTGMEFTRTHLKLMESLAL